MGKLDDFENLRTRLRACPILFANLMLNFRPFHYQAKILKDKSKRVVACFGRQTGKTTIVAVKAIHFAYTHPKVTVLIVSPSLRQSMIMFDRISNFIFSNKYLAASVKRKTRTIIQLSNGSKIIALPCSIHKLRGHTAHMVIVDEAAFVPDGVVVNILNPMLATTNGVLILISTPWGRNHFHKAFIDPDFSVHHVKSSECPLISAEFLRKQREYMTEEAYLMEYEAEFVEAAASYFAQDLIRNCVDAELEFMDENLVLKISLGESEWKRFIGEYYMGVDLGKLRDYSAVAIIKKKKKHVQLVLIKEFPLETPYAHVMGFISRANQRFHFRKILIDKGSVGEPIIEELKKQGLTNVEGVNFTLQSKAEMLAYLRLKMEQGLFRMPYNHRLCQQLNEQRYEYTKSGQLRFWHPPYSHDDQLWALVLATWAARRERKSGVLLSV